MDLLFHFSTDFGLKMKLINTAFIFKVIKDTLLIPSVVMKYTVEKFSNIK